MCITLWYFRNLNLILKKIPLDKNFSDKNFENKLKKSIFFPLEFVNIRIKRDTVEAA